MICFTSFYEMNNLY